MTISRAQQINLNETAYYHCISRCVRQSYLCGINYETGKDYSYRKEWILQQIKRLSTIFSIKICAYAIMSNHYHLVLYVDVKAADHWDENDIRERWGKLFYKDAKAWDALPDDCNEKFDKIALWNDRLMDISWFMKCLNEFIARLANKEDKCKGRFWDGRFKSQALLDEAAVISTMSYVDLNPIRAKLASTPETSFHTSIYERIQFAKKEICDTSKAEHFDNAEQPPRLMPFNNGLQRSDSAINFSLSEYLTLVDETGRDLRHGKRGYIPASLTPIFERLHLSSTNFKTFLEGIEERFSYAIGCIQKLCSYVKTAKERAPKGARLALQSYSVF